MRNTLTLPLPMSVNRMYTYNRYTHQKIYKKEARDYLAGVGSQLAAIMRRDKAAPIDDYTHLDLFFFLPRKNADSHNYKKLLFDALQHGGVVTDDRYILDRTQKVEIDTKNPRVIIKWVGHSKVKKV